MGKVTLAEKYQVHQAAELFLELGHLDSLWTNHLRQNQKVGSEDLDTLRTIVNRMAELLERSGEHTQFLETLIATRQRDAEFAIRKLLASDALVDADKYEWSRIAASEGGITTAATGALSFVRDRAQAERETLLEKLQQIEETGSTTGDMPTEFMCGFYSGIAIAAGVAQFWPVAFVSASAAGWYCGLRFGRGKKEWDD